MVDPDGALETLTSWQADVTDKFTWFYIVANPVFTFFVLWLVICYGDIKLGKKDEEPEFDDSSYFMMLFSAGVGIGLFFFGVSEPLAHRTSNWFAETGYRAQDEIDQWALMLTMYHWGFAVSTVTGCCCYARGEIMIANFVLRLSLFWHAIGMESVHCYGRCGGHCRVSLRFANDGTFFPFSGAGSIHLGMDG
jgi:hypothetical protein